MNESATVVDGDSSSRRAVAGRPVSRRGGRAFLLVPLILVNAAAVWGQAGWAYENITAGGWAGIGISVLFAAAVESIGIYLAWEAHESLMADQASAQLRVGSYAIGGLAGVLNFLHFSVQSTATGIAFGCLSAVSPWLWAIWSRARNRGRLAELGLVDVRGVKLSTVRKVWHPVRSLRVMSWAAWEGVTSPQEAVAGWTASQDAPEVVRAAEDDLRAETSKRDRVLALLAVRPELTAEQIAEEAGCSARYVRKIKEES